jgi:Eco57I restriction-modification methylase
MMRSSKPLLEQALREHAGEEEWEEAAIAALGLAEAMRLLSCRYHLVITNVPYLARGKQDERLRRFAQERYPKAKNDLANLFLERCLEFSLPEDGGVTQIVMPQNWLFLTSYKKQREHLLKEVRWDLLARLGPGAFDTISGEVVNVILLTLTRSRPTEDDQLHGIDASAPRMAAGKAEVLRQGEVVAVNQRGQLGNPNARVAFGDMAGELLSEFAVALNGMHGADSPRFRFSFWEVNNRATWRLLQNTVDETDKFSGWSQIFYWPDNGEIHKNNPQARIQGDVGWGYLGVTVSMMRNYHARYTLVRPSISVLHRLFPTLRPTSPPSGASARPPNITRRCGSLTRV